MIKVPIFTEQIKSEANDGKCTINGNDYRFEGKILSGKANGFGKLFCAGGVIFSSNFKDGFLDDDEGRIEFDDKILFGEFKNGRLNGKSRVTAQQAQNEQQCVDIHGNFLNNLQVGLWQFSRGDEQFNYFFSDEGHLIKAQLKASDYYEEGRFSNDQRSGQWFYVSSGTKATYTYQNDKKHGPFREQFENFTEFGQFQNGIKMSVVREFVSGRIEEGNVTNQEKSGLWTEIENNVTSQGCYENGVKCGKWMIIKGSECEDKEEQWSGNFVNGLKSGEWVWKNNNKLYKCAFRRGKQINLWETEPEQIEDVFQTFL